MESHVGGAQISAQADQVVRFRSAAVGDPVLGDVARCRHADCESVDRGCRVSACQIGPVTVAGRSYPVIQPIDHFDREAGRDAERQFDLPRRSVHGEDVGNSRDDRLVAQMLQRIVCQVEMHALEQQFGREQHVAVACVDYGRIVAAAFDRRGVLRLDARADSFDESEFSDFGDFGSFFSFHKLFGLLSQIYKDSLSFAQVKNYINFVDVCSISS